jgi:mannitol-1-phosphate/altronate dehydrogenase
MKRPSPTQQASAQTADAIFADPALRDRFERMAKDTANREPVRDDFAWLSRIQKPESQFSRFRSLAQKLFRVPKSEATATDQEAKGA